MLQPQQVLHQLHGLRERPIWLSAEAIGLQSVDLCGVDPLSVKSRQPLIRQHSAMKGHPAIAAGNASEILVAKSFLNGTIVVTCLDPATNGFIAESTVPDDFKRGTLTTDATITFP